MPADTSPLYPHRRDAGYGVDCRCAAKSGIVRRDGELWGDHCPVAMREEIARLKAGLAEMAATVRREALEEAARECEGLGRDFAQAFPEQDRRTISVVRAAYSDAALNIRELAKKEAP